MKNLVIFADEIYDRLLLDGATNISIASLDPEACCVTFNGLSKSYVGPGLRIGWGIVSGPDELVNDYIAAINRILRARLSANHPHQYAIAPSLLGPQPHLPSILEKLTQRRDITTEMLNEIEGISCVRPGGAFYAFPQLHGVDDDEKWVKALIRETGVVVVPGSGFGQRPGSSHFRVVFLPPNDTLTAAYEKIALFHKNYRQRT